MIGFRPSTERLRVAVLGVVAVLVVATLVWRFTAKDDRTVTAYFASASALYVGNPVEVLGVPVGSVKSVTPQPGRVKVVIRLDDDVKVPRDVHAVQVSPSLIAGRSIALEPVYRGGPTLDDDAVIPLARTEVPLDVNDLYTSAQDLATALGPKGANKNGSVTRAFDVLAENLKGNGADLAEAIDGLADATGTLSGGRDDLTGTVRNLQRFVGTLAGHDDQVRSLSRKLADVTGFLADDRDDLGKALRQLSVTLGEVADFVQDNRAVLRSNVDRLSKVTGVLVKERRLLGRIIDEAPTGLGNLFNAYDAAGGTLDVRMDISELQLGPGALLCEMVHRITPSQLPDALGDLCSSTIGGLKGLPALADVLSTLQAIELPDLTSLTNLTGGRR